MKITYTKKLEKYYAGYGFNIMPEELILQILKFAGILTTFGLKSVCKKWYRIIKGEFNMPPWINRYLPPVIQPLLYQFEVVKWMVAQKHGGIINMEQGMGKTNTCLTFINLTFSLRNLVLCKKSQMSIWKEEPSKFYQDKFKVLLCHKEYDGDIRDFTEETLALYDIVVVTYESAKHIVDRKNPVSQIFWNNVFCDEVHYLRNKPPSMYLYVDKIKRTRFWGLTGSLVFNSIADARNIQELIEPSSVYSTHNIKVLRFADVNITMPLLHVHTIDTPRTKRQDDIYKRYETKAVDLLEELGSHSKNLADVFTMIHRMRQTSISLGLLKKSHSKLGELEDENLYKSPRIEKICDIIQAHQGQCVVFCYYRETLEFCKSNLATRGIKSALVKSEDTLAMRKFRIDRFMRKKSKALLMTYAVGAHGYNFTNADLVILCSPWWNMQVMQQAFKRCYRLGQDLPVNVYMFATKDSIEDRMLQICMDKDGLEKALLADHKPKHKLTIDEIKSLFT